MWELFQLFFKIGLLSFGGGFAMIPVIQYELKSRGWLDPQQFTEAIAVAGLSPGPIATNCAIFIGYHMEGMFGAIVSTLAISLPSVIVILLFSKLDAKWGKQKSKDAAFYGLRPVITGLIFYAALQLAIQNQVIGGLNGLDLFQLSLLLVSFLLLMSKKLHPVNVLLLSGVAGVWIYI